MLLAEHGLRAAVSPPQVPPPEGNPRGTYQDWIGRYDRRTAADRRRTRREMDAFPRHPELAFVMPLAAGDTSAALEAVLACFPAGTLSGAPKVRAMEIIDELELSRRGLYGGVVGYFDFAGNADVAIAIRTALMADGVAHVQAGAGIVADSVPELEDAECSHKARAVISAIGRAEAMSPR